MLDRTTGRRLLALKDEVIARFNHGHWRELAVLLGQLEMVDAHPRLLRSLTFGDPDYEGHALAVLTAWYRADENSLAEVAAYLTRKFPPPDDALNVASVEAGKPRIVFQPQVFEIPNREPDPQLVAAMMPFSASFTPVYDCVRSAAEKAGMTCHRADDIWTHSTIIQEVFSLIYRSHIVVCDFTGRNPNVFYEAGIAHTLGKHVIPITQSAGDVPFDLAHHRYIHYLPNGEGLWALSAKLVGRMEFLRS